jgi:GNAT superfamily N-acetyltransferase
LAMDEKTTSAVSLRIMDITDINPIVDIHHAALSDSLNSQLGLKHLAFIYTTMLKDPHSIIVVAHVENCPVGVVSASLNPAHLKQLIHKALNFIQWTKLACHFIREPKLMLYWHEHSKLDKSVYYNHEIVDSCLTAIAVDPEYRRFGIGRMLVARIETYFKHHGRRAYRLDTRASNSVSRLFYQCMGFVEIEKRGNNIILVKDLMHE